MTLMKTASITVTFSLALILHPVFAIEIQPIQLSQATSAACQDLATQTKKDVIEDIKITHGRFEIPTGSILPGCSFEGSVRLCTELPSLGEFFIGNWKLFHQADGDEGYSKGWENANSVCFVSQHCDTAEEAGKPIARTLSVQCADRTALFGTETK